MLVTIGIPFYNAEKTLLFAIQSVFAQTYTNWELILVDDGSTDKSLDIALSINDPRVRVIYDNNNMGLVERLNLIAREARGFYLARMDADDMMFPDRIEKQLNYMIANPQVDVIGGRGYIVDENNQVLFKFKSPVGTPSHKSILKSGLFVHPTVFGRTSWFVNNPYDKAFHRAEDLELWLRTLSTSNFVSLDEKVLLYRLNSHFPINNYQKSCKTDRKIILKYATENCDRMTALGLLIESYVKQAMLLVINKVGIGKSIISKRYLNLVEGEKENVENILIEIINTRVPVTRIK